MKKRALSLALATAVAAAGLVAASGSAAQAEYWESDEFNCVGPYTSGYATSTAGPGWVGHYRLDWHGWTYIESWWNSSTTGRISHYHGAGSQYAVVSADNVLYAHHGGCEYIG